MSAKQAIADLKALASFGKAAELQRFFKTGPGDYAEGDLFIGVVVPQTRKVAARFKDLPLNEIAKLTDSDIHEVRLCGLIILTNQFKRSRDVSNKKKRTFEEKRPKNSKELTSNQEANKKPTK